MNLSKLHRYYLYLTIFVTGAAVLVLEILGSRILAPFYGTTIYVWSSLIAVALFALSLGYFIGGVISDRHRKLYFFYLIYILAGLSLILTFQYKAVIFFYSDKLGFKFGPLLASLILFGPTLTFLGMISPFAIKLLTQSLTSVGRRAGFVFAFSTLGSLLGALLAGFFLLPLVSSGALMGLIAILLIVLGVIGYLINGGSLKKIKFIRDFFFVFFALYLIGIPFKNEVFKQVPQRAQILYEKENFYGLNRVVAVPVVGGKVCFMVDNSIQTCVPPGPGIDRVGYNGKIGLFIKNLPPGSEVLILGFGSGKLLRDWDREDLFFDIVDINPEAFKAAENYSGVKFDKVRHKLFTEDARAFLRESDAKYDLVVVDTFSGFSPPEHLFTKEFYGLLSSRMKEGGMSILHMLGDVDPSDKYVASLLSTIASVFKDVYAADDGVSILVPVFQDSDSGLVDLVNKDIAEINAWAEGALSPFADISTRDEFLSAAIITDDRNFTEVLWRDKVPIIKIHTIILSEDYR